MKTTLKDLAKRLNIAESTVSRALANDPRISLETRSKVLQLANELNYHPNLVAKSLKLQRTKVIGLIIGDITNPFYPEIVRGIEDVANKNGFNIILCNSDQNPQKELDYLKVLIGRQMDGIIMTSMVNKDSIRFISTYHIPSVLVDIKPIPHIKTSYVYADQEYGGYIATKHLIDIGHKKIALVNGPSNLSPSSQLRSGYLNALSESGIAPNQDYIIESVENLKPEGGYTSMVKLLSLDKKHRPTAALFIGDITVIGAYEAIQERGLKIPRDFSVIGYDDIIISKYLSPPLTTVYQPKYELGETSMNLLLKKIKNNDGFTKIKLKPELRIRKSTAPPCE